MRETKQFQVFGRDYRITQHSAIESMRLLNLEKQPPREWLKYTEVFNDGAFVRLDNDAALNSFVFDRAGIMRGHQVLSHLTRLAIEYSTGFLKDWTPIKVPSKFRSNLSEHQMQRIKIEHTEPLIQTLITKGLATMKELSIDYSLKDAVKMNDMQTASMLAEAMANDNAAKEAKSNK